MSSDEPVKPTPPAVRPVLPAAFEQRFGQLGGVLLRALARRRDRAQRREAALTPRSLGRAPTGDEVLERAHWQDLHRHYDLAHGAVHHAMVLVHYAGCLLLRIRRDRR